MPYFGVGAGGHGFAVRGPGFAAGGEARDTRRSRQRTATAPSQRQRSDRLPHSRPRRRNRPCREFYGRPGDWRLHYFVVDTRNWWFGKRVLISPVAVKSIDLFDRHVELDVSREKVKSSPLWDPLVTFGEIYAQGLHTHYRWPGLRASRRRIRSGQRGVFLRWRRTSPRGRLVSTAQANRGPWLARVVAFTDPSACHSANGRNGGGAWMKRFVKGNGKPCHLSRHELRRRGIRVCRDDETGQGCRTEVSQADHEEMRPTAECRHRPPSSICGNERNCVRRARAVRVCLATPFAPLAGRYNLSRRKRSAFAITETELNDIASAPTIGLRRMPKDG